MAGAPAGSDLCGGGQSHFGRDERHAQGLAKHERVQVRERVVCHGHGKTATEERLRTELVGIAGLTTSESYGDRQQTQ